MNKTKIEWVKNPDGTQGYTWNPITGCLNHNNGLCNGGLFPCYSYKLANGRLKQRYLANKKITPALGELCDTDKAFADPFYPRFWESRLNWHRVYSVNSELTKGIFVCDMGDLFGIGIPEEWTRRVLDYIRTEFEDRFYLLTKQPQNLIKFSPFPDNCWVGVTATSSRMFVKAMDELYDVEAKVKFISLEPLLEWHIEPKVMYGNLTAQRLDWLIIGACTGTNSELTYLKEKYPELTLHIKEFGMARKWTAQPKIEWVREIVEAADKAGIKVFLKDNLYQLYLSNPQYSCHFMFKDARLRQEMPQIK